MMNNLSAKPRVWRVFCVCLAWSLTFTSIFAQIKPIQPKSVTRAVIVGISDYRNDLITDLRFADRDAQIFADFLASAAGGNVPTENVKVLTNEKATLGQIVSALTWLKDESKAGDKAIIYFSGHGDMETLTGLSFLLAHDASANAYSGGGGFPVFSLQAVISILSTQKNVQVLLITDACRAGKLAGNEVNGVQATAKILSDQFANEVKVLSCQPNEFSLESTAWGGGRGVFSYYLIDGLKGLADNNQDQVVTLLELSRYLEDQVPTATAPHSQIP
ncbi:MAG: caspase family protein, partial [Saprospiraceae bacterium]|nr:caspase family protein [Saprospiraceae bacterium]